MKGHHHGVLGDLYQCGDTEESPADRGPHPALRLVGQQVVLEQDGGVVGDGHHPQIALGGAEALGGELPGIEGLMDGFEGVLDGPSFLVEAEDPHGTTGSGFPLEAEGVAFQIGDETIENGGGSVVDASFFRALDPPSCPYHDQSDRLDGSWEEQHRPGVQDRSGVVDLLPISRSGLGNRLLDGAEVRLHFGEERVRLSQQEVEIRHAQKIPSIDPQQIDASQHLFYLVQQRLQMMFAVDIATVQDLVEDHAAKHPHTPQIAVSPFGSGVFARFGFLPLSPFRGAGRPIYVDNPQFPGIEMLLHGLDLGSDQVGVDAHHLPDLPPRTPIQKAVQRLLCAKPRHPQHRCQVSFRSQLVVDVTDPLDTQDRQDDQGDTEISHGKIPPLMHQADLRSKGFFQVKHLQQKQSQRVEKTIRRQGPGGILHPGLPHFLSALLSLAHLPLHPAFSRVSRISFAGTGSGAICHGTPLLSLEVKGEMRLE